MARGKGRGRESLTEGKHVQRCEAMEEGLAVQGRGLVLLDWKLPGRSRALTAMVRLTSPVSMRFREEGIGMVAGGGGRGVGRRRPDGGGGHLFSVPYYISTQTLLSACLFSFHMKLLSKGSMAPSLWISGPVYLREL